MLINFVDATNDANHYTKLPPCCEMTVKTPLSYLQKDQLHLLPWKHPGQPAYPNKTTK